jgi:N utilization substance protein B
VLTDKYLDEYPQKEEVESFSRLLVSEIIANIEYIDAMLSKYVKNWQIDRMAVIDRNVLRIGCCELLFIKDVPPKVAINEAIELAKRFGDLDSPRFTNGILDKIYKMEQEEIDRRKDPSKN